MEPRFKKDMEEKSVDKKRTGKKRETDQRTKYLRLGYTKTPRKQKVRAVECPAGKENCKNCKGANAVSPENLAGEQSGAEAIAPLFEGAMPERRCYSDIDDGCGGEE